MGKKKQNQDDLIDLVERIVVDTKEAGEKTVILNIQMMRDLLELAKLAPEPQGRPPLKRYVRVQESMVILKARSRKKQLIAEGMPREKAHEIAAEEAVAKLAEKKKEKKDYTNNDVEEANHMNKKRKKSKQIPRIMAVSTMKRRMQ